LIARYEAGIDPVLRWRRWLRHLPGGMNDVARPFTFRELFEVVLTRDTWMHRLDTSRASGIDFEMTGASWPTPSAIGPPDTATRSGCS